MDEDTVRLLRECESGVKTGIRSIDEVLKKVEGESLRSALERSRQTHIELGDRAHELLDRCGASGKEPSTMAEACSWMKTNATLAMEPGDGAVITLMAEGCGMGVKGLGKAICKYPTASNEAKAITNELLAEQQRFLDELQRLAGQSVANN